MIEEIWKSLDFMGYPDYQVSNMGRVKSFERNGTKGGILKQGKNKYGYLLVVLCKNGVTKTFAVHQLVALTFLKNPNNLPQINHKDENKENNHVDNLEWVTPKENVNYGTRNERACKANKGRKRSEETKQKMSETKRIPILQYTKDMVFIRDWDSAKTVSTELNINQSNITQCCKNKRKSVGGFIWRYKENNTNLVIS